MGKVWLWFIVVVCLGACASGPDSSAEWFCEGLCDAMVRCESGSSERNCEADCVDGRPGLVNFSESGARALGSCLSRADCSSVYDEELFDACADEARNELDASDATRRFCVSYVENAFECGYSDSHTSCEQGVGMWADSVIKRLARCEEHADCEVFFACMEGVYASL